MQMTLLLKSNKQRKQIMIETIKMGLHINAQKSKIQRCKKERKG